jgi:hypothetical protein
LIFLTTAALGGFGDDFEWIGGASPNWADPNNWQYDSGGGMTYPALNEPTTGDDVVIPTIPTTVLGPFYPVLSATVDVENLTVKSGASIDLNSYLLRTGSDIEIQATGTITGTGTISVGNDAILNGTINIDGSLSVADTANIGADITTTGTQTYNGPLAITGSPTLTGLTVTVLGGASGTLNIVGGAQIDTTPITTGLAALTVSGTAAISTNITSSGTQNYNGTLTLGGSPTTLQGSTVTVSGGASGNLAITGNAVFNTAPVTGLGTLTVSGTAAISTNITSSGTQN